MIKLAHSMWCLRICLISITALLIFACAKTETSPERVGSKPIKDVGRQGYAKVYTNPDLTSGPRLVVLGKLGYLSWENATELRNWRVIYQDQTQEIARHDHYEDIFTVDGKVAKIQALDYKDSILAEIVVVELFSFFG